MKSRDSTDNPLPAGLYRHGQKFRARGWVDEHGIIVAHKPPSAARRAWCYFEPPLSLAVAAFYEWRGAETNPDQGEVYRACQSYLASARFQGLAPETRRTEKPRVERLMRTFGHMRIASIAPRHINEYLERRSDAPHAAKKEIKRLSAMFTYWIAAELAPSNPCTAVLRVMAEPDNARDRYVTDEEYDRALAAALDFAFHRGTSGRIVYAVMRLELLTGRRESDLLRLRHADVTEDGIVFGEGKTYRKTGVRTIVGWTDELREAHATIKRLMKPGLTLITNRDGEPVTTGTFNRAWQTVKQHIALAGVEPFQPRDVRAKHGTDMEDDGANLGHASKSTFYKHYQRKPKKIRSLR